MGDKTYGEMAREQRLKPGLFVADHITVLEARLASAYKREHELEEDILRLTAEMESARTRAERLFLKLNQAEARLAAAERVVVDEALAIVAKHVAATAVEKFVEDGWEEYSWLGEYDWDKVVTMVLNLVPWPDNDEYLRGAEVLEKRADLPTHEHPTPDARSGKAE